MIIIGFGSDSLLEAIIKSKDYQNHQKEDRIYIDNDSETAWLPKDVLEFKSVNEAKKFLIVNKIRSKYVDIKPIVISQKVIKYYKRDKNYCTLIREYKMKK